MGKKPRYPRQKARGATRPRKRPTFAPRPDPEPSEIERLVNDGAMRDAIDRVLDPDSGKGIDEVCERLFQQLKKLCPHLVPEEPVQAGGVGPRIDLAPKTAATLLRGAAVKLAGDDQTVWVLGDSEMLVFVSRVELKTEAGRILVTIPVRTDQTDVTVITVPFAVGTEKRPAGLMAAAPMRPIGPEAIVELWADALTAFAWGAVLTLAEALANRSGQDPDRQGLIAFNLAAQAEGLTIGTMARHGFDRRAR